MALWVANATGTKEKKSFYLNGDDVETIEC